MKNYVLEKDFEKAYNYYTAVGKFYLKSGEVVDDGEARLCRHTPNSHQILIDGVFVPFFTRSYSHAFSKRSAMSSLHIETHHMGTIYYCEHCGSMYDLASLSHSNGLCHCEMITCRYCGEILTDEDEKADGIHKACEVKEKAQTISYSTKPLPIFEDGENRSKKLHFGFELEVEPSDRYTTSSVGRREDIASEVWKILDGDLNGDGKKQVYFKMDGSLRESGLEIITQPKTLNYWVENEDKLKAVCDVVAGEKWRSHDGGNCGLHIHLDRAYFDGESAYHQAKMIFFVGMLWDDFLRLSRRDKGHTMYCERNIIESCDDWAIIKRSATDRRNAVNIQPQNTIELRFFRGSLIADTLIASMDIACALAKLSMHYKLSTLKEKTKEHGIALLYKFLSTDVGKAYFKRKFSDKTKILEAVEKFEQGGAM